MDGRLWKEVTFAQHAHDARARRPPVRCLSRVRTYAYIHHSSAKSVSSLQAFSEWREEVLDLLKRLGRTVCGSGEKFAENEEG